MGMSLGVGAGARGLGCEGREREGVEREGGKKERERERQTRTVRDDGVTVLEFEADEEDANRWIAPFLACGDLSAWDADATYRLPRDRVSLDPVQPPTAPPYKRALEMRRREGGAYGKTKS